MEVDGELEQVAEKVDGELEQVDAAPTLLKSLGL